MEQLVELLQQIQELAGVAIDALSEAGGEAAPEGGGPEGGAPPEGEPRPGGEGPPEGETE